MDNNTTIIIGIVLILIMFGMGLSLVPTDFKNIFKYPKAIGLGLLNQLFFLPIIGFSILNILQPSPEIAIGLMILASCPGGTVSNLICYLAKADVALSVSLTAISSIISVFTIPFIINFSIKYFTNNNDLVELSLSDTVLQISIVVIIPVVIGMFIRNYLPNFAKKADKTVRIFSIIVLLLLISGVTYKERNNFILYFKQAGIVSLLLNIITLAFGYFSAKLIHLSKHQAISISLESGIQNSALAISIAVALLKNTSFAIVPSIYTLLMYFTGALIIVYQTRNSKS